MACSHQPSILDQIETYDMQNIIVSIHSTAETEETVTSCDVSASIAQCWRMGVAPQLRTLDESARAWAHANRGLQHTP